MGATEDAAPRRVIAGQRRTCIAWRGTHSGYRAHMRELPGADLVRQGIRDLERGVESVEALLVSIGAPRLRDLGLALPQPLENAEHRLYEKLRDEHGDAAHSRYNALVRRLVRYERAAGVTRTHA